MIPSFYDSNTAFKASQAYHIYFKKSWEENGNAENLVYVVEQENGPINLMSKNPSTMGFKASHSNQAYPISL
jgi:hypothetical protein